MTTSTEATTTTCGRLVERLRIVTVAEEILLKNLQQLGGLTTTASSLGGVQVEDNVEDKKINVK